MCDILRQTATEPRLQRVLAISTQKVEYVGELNGIRERHLRVREQALRRIEGLLRLAAASGQLAEGLSAGAAARALHSLVDGLIANWMLDRDAFDLRRVGRTAVDQLIAGLQRPESPGRKTSPKRVGTPLEAAMGQRRVGKEPLARPRKVK